jgi:hypothetical protein
MTSTSTSTTTAKTNLFAAAKKKEQPKAKDEKATVVVPESTHEGFSKNLMRLETLRSNMKRDEAEAKMLETEIKQRGQSEFLRLYDEQRVRPESFKLAGENGGKFLFMVIDKYATVPDETRAKELKEAYGDDVVTSSKEYSFNPELLKAWERDGVLDERIEALSTAIVECGELSDSDKENLITVTEKYSITKGMIDKLQTIKQEERTGFFYQIQPECQLKNTK